MTDETVTPGNPAVFFVNGQDTRSFTYEPGQYPWYVKMWAGSWQVMDLLLFADSHYHAGKILGQLCDFWQECLDQYEEYQSGDIHHHPVLVNKHSYSRKKLGKLRALLEGREVVWEKEEPSPDDPDEVMHLAITPLDRSKLVRVHWSDRGLD